MHGQANISGKFFTQTIESYLFQRACGILSADSAERTFDGPSVPGREMSWEGLDWADSGRLAIEIQPNWQFSSPSIPRSNFEILLKLFQRGPIFGNYAN